MKHTVRPLSDHTWLRPDSKRRPSRFEATWSATTAQLGREVAHLGGRDLVIEVDVPERGIRLDGQLRADARAATPAVVVAFESKHGPLLYRSDVFAAGTLGWQHNVRAVVLTLEALRAVDRYGATETGQQYTGFKAIGPGPNTDSGGGLLGGAFSAVGGTLMNRDEATDVMRRWAGDSNGTPDELYRRARAAAHPDRNGGDHAGAYEVAEAAQALWLAR